MYTKEQLKMLHSEESFHHKDKILNSKICGCFYCLSNFTALEIEEWIDEDSTALCPKCGIDSVLPEKYSDKETLKIMQKYAFSNVDFGYGYD